VSGDEESAGNEQQRAYREINPGDGCSRALAKHRANDDENDKSEDGNLLPSREQADGVGAKAQSAEQHRYHKAVKRQSP
jgi:hypothetical protein